MSKLPIFNNGTLNQLLREPVLQDRRSEHVKFQQHAHELIEKVSGPMSRKNYENNDITLDMLHRASVVASTKIRFRKKILNRSINTAPLRYNDKQLWALIHEHMVLSGLSKSAEMLRFSNVSSDIRVECNLGSLGQRRSWCLWCLTRFLVLQFTHSEVAW